MLNTDGQLRNSICVFVYRKINVGSWAKELKVHICLPCLTSRQKFIGKKSFNPIPTVLSSHENRR